MALPTTTKAMATRIITLLVAMTEFTAATAKKYGYNINTGTDNIRDGNFWAFLSHQNIALDRVVWEIEVFKHYAAVAEGSEIDLSDFMDVIDGILETLSTNIPSETRTMSGGAMEFREKDPGANDLAGLWACMITVTFRRGTANGT